MWTTATPDDLALQRTRRRAVQLKLIRQRDKYRIFNSKPELLKYEETKRIYINSEKTAADRARDGTLNEWKAQDKNLKFSIRNGTLSVKQGNQENRYFLDKDGKVQPVRSP